MTACWQTQKGWAIIGPIVVIVAVVLGSATSLADTVRAIPSGVTGLKGGDVYAGGYFTNTGGIPSV